MSLYDSLAENVLIFHTLFKKPLVMLGLRLYTGTHKSHRQVRAKSSYLCVSLKLIGAL